MYLAICLLFQTKNGSAGLELARNLGVEHPGKMGGVRRNRRSP